MTCNGKLVFINLRVITIKVKEYETQFMLNETCSTYVLFQIFGGVVISNGNL